MTPAEELRAAAAKVRKTAVKAAPGPWKVCRAVGIGCVVHDPTVTFCITVETKWVSGGDAAWIALASPTLAGPLAAWLESCAGQASAMAASDDWGICDEPGSAQQALDVARAILGCGS